MLLVTRDGDGNIIAVCEYAVTFGKAVEKYGNLMHIHALEVSQKYRRSGAIRQVIRLLLQRHPQSERCTWRRRHKYPTRGLKEYTREQFELLVKEGDNG